VIADEIFQKTPKGRTEMETKSDALSMRERRVLILTNGERTAALIKEQSLFSNIIEILENLEQLGYIGRLSSSLKPAAQLSAGMEVSY